MALKTKGGHVPKAGPKRRRHKTEQEAIRAAVEENKIKVRPARKSGQVRKYRYKEGEKNSHAPHLTEEQLMYQLRTPQGLSVYGQWMELQLPGWGVWDWWLLFDPDKELWPFIVEIAKEEVPDGSD